MNYQNAYYATFTFFAKHMYEEAAVTMLTIPRPYHNFKIFNT